jgi:amino acid transporter
VNDGPLEASPYYTLALVAGLAWLAWILRFSAVVSPGSCGLIYITTTSRISYGMSKDSYLPKAFEQTSKKTKIRCCL